MFQATEWNPSKSGAANGIIGFFIGMSGFVGTIVCTLYVNPENILMDRVYDPDHPELGKLTNWISLIMENIIWGGGTQFCATFDKIITLSQ